VRLVSDQCSVVLVGSWNRAILTPDWIALNVLKASPPEFDTLEMELMVVPPFVLRMRSKRASVTVDGGRLQLGANTPDEDGMAAVNIIVDSSTKPRRLRLGRGGLRGPAPPPV
jgi:hypothetical protein